MNLERYSTLQYADHPGFRAVGRGMYRLVEDFSEDLDMEFRGMSLRDAVQYVSSRGYKSDDEFGGDIEVISRPGLMSGPLDCKKMCILLGAWARRNNHRFRFLAVAEADLNHDGVVDEKDIHHVVILIFTRGIDSCVMIDPTRGFDVAEPLYYEVL